MLVSLLLGTARGSGGAAGGGEKLLDLRNAPTKDSGSGCCGSNPKWAVDGVVSPTNLGWGQCQQWSSVHKPWWGVDLGKSQQVTKVKMYNRNDCCPDRLTRVSVWLGNNWNSYNANPQVAQNINVPQRSPLEVQINKQGRYLFVGRPNDSGLTLCEIQVWATNITGNTSIQQNTTNITSIATTKSISYEYVPYEFGCMSDLFPLWPCLIMIFNLIVVRVSPVTILVVLARLMFDRARNIENYERLKKWLMKDSNGLKMLLSCFCLHWLLGLWFVYACASASPCWWGRIYTVFVGGVLPYGGWTCLMFASFGDLQDEEEEAVHEGVHCAVSKMQPIVGPRYSKKGCDYDLCEAEFEKLDEASRALFQRIDCPGAEPVDMAPPQQAATGTGNRLDAASAPPETHQDDYTYLEAAFFTPASNPPPVESAEEMKAAGKKPAVQPVALGAIVVLRDVTTPQTQPSPYPSEQLGHVAIPVGTPVIDPGATFHMCQSSRMCGSL